MDSDALLIAGCFFACVLTSMMVAHLGYFASARATEDRLTDMAVRARADANRIDGLGLRLVRWAIRRVPAPKANAARSEKTARMLAYAGFHAPGAVRAFASLRVLTVIVLGAGGLVGGLLSGVGKGPAILYGVASAMAGNVAPVFILGRIGTLRQRAIRRELGDILDLLVVCVESGLGLFQAIRTVGREAQRQGHRIGSELTMLVAGITSGASLGEGLRAMSERTGVEEMKALGAILIQSEKLGSQLGPALRASSEALRTRRRLAAEEAAQKATIKMLLPLVIFVLPAMMAVILGPGVVQVFRNFRGHG